MAPFSPFLSLSLFLFISVRAEMNSTFKQPSTTALIANVSSQFLPNTSSTSVSNFPYIIPFGQAQACNIYGPVCQTGSITVGVNLTTATTTTVLPCSSYLSAQSVHLIYENDPGLPAGLGQGFWSNDHDDGSDLSDWVVSFGQSPECYSYAKAMSQGQYTFSDCGSSNTVISTAGGLNFDYPPQVPPAVARYFYPDESGQGTCCGNCSLNIPEVRLYYFSDEITNCYNHTSNITSTSSTRNLEKRIHSLVANGSTAVISGHTFTSPSLYIQLIGTATIHDQCTTVGPKLTDPIITLAPGELSTWKPPVDKFPLEEYDNFTVGEIWQDPSGVIGFDYAGGIAPLDIKDLACPTWGLGRSTAVNGTVFTTIGPPWLPLIMPPIELFSLDSKWASSCTGVFTDEFGLTTLALFDPPTVLTPASLLVPTPPARPIPTPVPTPADPTTVPERATSYAETAKPASLPNDPAAPPARTGDPGKESPSQSPVAASADHASPPQNSAASSKNKGDPPSDPKVPLASEVAGDPPADPPSNPKVPPVSAVVGDPPAESIAPSFTAPDSPSDPKVPNVPVPPPGEDPKSQSQGLGAFIYNAFGRSGPDVEASFTSSILTVGAQTFTVNPTGFKINDAAISPGGTAHTVDGTIISLDQSGILAIGSSTVSLIGPSPTTILTVADQTFTPNPTAFSIAGSIVSAGGSAITVDGTTISLDESGALAIGSTTISLTDPSSTPFATKAFTVAGQTFTPNPSAFSIAGTTISADGPAITISGTIVSLGPNGALEIGSSTIDLPSLLDPSPSKVYTVAGQTFTPNPSAFPVAGNVLSAGGPAITVDGTIISLGQSGVLAIGSSTIDLPSLSDPSPSKVYTIAGQTFTPNPSAFPIANTIISAGGPPATINGTTISLEPSGTLIIGSSTIPLSTTSDISIDGFDINAQSSFIVVDGVTLNAAAAGVTISGTLVSLEAGGATLDIGTGRFALPTATTGAANGSVNVQAFTGGQEKGREFPLALMCGVCGIVLLLTI